MNLRETALEYYNAGLNVLPASRKQKRPIGSWRKFTKQRPSFDEAFPVGVIFDAIAVVCGQTSGGLEVIDFDLKAKLFPAYQGIVADAIFNFPVEKTQSGGKHIAFRSDACGRNQKLAMIEEGCAIETRAEGGICIIAPSLGYEIESGDWRNVPTISVGQRDFLIESAKSLSKEPAKSAQKQSSVVIASSVPFQGETAADKMKRDGAGKQALIAAGWEYLYEDEAYEYWKRPGQTVADKPGGSFNKRDGFFHVFTSNAPPFEPSKTYSQLQVVALLNHNGDQSEAAREYLRRNQHRGASDRIIETFNPCDVEEVCLTASTIEYAEQQEIKQSAPRLQEVTLPKELFTCGGMIQELLELTNQYAIRRQPEGSFLGALADMSFLTGRSLALSFNGTLVTPNIYALFLAPSGMGKEIIRRVGSEVARIYAPCESVPDSFASVQALQNLITRRKKILWLHDEFGRDLAVMAGERTNSNVTSVITESLKLFSNANNRAYLPKVVAQEAKGAKQIEPVDRPSLTIFATGNPREFFDATCEAVMSNGYIARFTTVKGRSYSEKKEVTFEEANQAEVFNIPASVRSSIKRWSDFEMTANESPFIVKFKKEPFDLIMDFDSEIESEIRNNCESADGSAEFKARLFEKVWKYALLFTASKYGARNDLVVDLHSAQCAVALAKYETALFAANQSRFASNEQTRFSNEVVDWCRVCGGHFTKSQFTRKFQRRGSLRERDEVLTTMLDAELLIACDILQDGKIKKGYKLNA